MGCHGRHSPALQEVSALAVGRMPGMEVSLLPCAWSPFPPPPVLACLSYAPGTGLQALLRSLAPPSRAENNAPDSPVWEDDCLEFFFTFDGVNYVNLEGNSRGALHAAIGPDRHDRRLLARLGVPMPTAVPQREPGGWALRFTVPTETITALYGLTPGSGTIFQANLYACGDCTDQPYYAAWQPPGTRRPDFHRPEYFGACAIL